MALLAWHRRALQSSQLRVAASTAMHDWLTGLAGTAHTPEICKSLQPEP